MAYLESVGNRIAVSGELLLQNLWRLSATIHALVTKQGYSDIHLDFSKCSRALPAPMLGLCAEAAQLRLHGVDISLTLPTDLTSARVFVNANWAHEIDPAHHKRSTYRGNRSMPVMKFDSTAEQTTAVNRLVDSILCTVTEVQRDDLNAIEWALNEVTDNVLVHSQSKVGGFVQLTNFPKTNRVEFSVADAGVGIPATLRHAFPDLNDSQLLERATREGVTRDGKVGQGNGLFGTFEVARASNGRFSLLSGFGNLRYESDELRLGLEKAPYPGTLVAANLDCANPNALADALRIGNKKYLPMDYIELRYEDRSTDDLVFRMQEETDSFGSRVAGTPVRQKLVALLRLNPNKRIRVDMSNVPFVSSSFADEVFGKLFKQIGPLGFASAIELSELSSVTRALIDKAIAQRMQSPN
jgi:anti-sigma regulatory factor (Ser/Thr protein kinase)